MTPECLSIIVIHIGGFGGQVVSVCLSPLRPQVQVSVRTFSMRLEPGPHVKRVKVNALPKVVGFLRVLRFPPTGKVDGVG
jgi:hypothetical protein